MGALLVHVFVYPGACFCDCIVACALRLIVWVNSRAMVDMLCVCVLLNCVLYAHFTTHMPENSILEMEACTWEHRLCLTSGGVWEGDNVNISYVIFIEISRTMWGCPRQILQKSAGKRPSYIGHAHFGTHISPSWAPHHVA